MTLELTNFKCFLSKEVNFKNLTILCGNNSSGKSSVIQSLLFLRYSLEEIRNNNSIIPLNGPFNIYLGTTDGLINHKSDSDQIIIKLIENTKSITANYQLNLYNSDLNVNLKSLQENEKCILGEDKFYYLNAERIGPRIVNNLKTLKYNHVGWQGEFTAQILSLENGYFKIDEKRLFVKETPTYIKDQVNLWLSYITGGVKVKANIDPKTLSSQIQLANDISTDFRTATNLGFGVSYVLPIIVNGLICEENSIFIVENPEAHLHPSAQTKIGKFLAMLSSCNIKVIIETHSEHIINAIQVEIANSQLNIDDVKINFFSQKDNEINIQEIDINKDGSLTEWPKNFFDESQKSYVDLLKARKNE